MSSVGVHSRSGASAALILDASLSSTRLLATSCRLLCSGRRGINIRQAGAAHTPATGCLCSAYSCNRMFAIVR